MSDSSSSAPADVLEKSANLEDTRRQILDQAARLLRMNGYASTSLRDIAAATRLKAGSIYYHFASKEILAETVMSEGIELVRATVKKALAKRSEESEPLDNISIAIIAHLQALHDSGDYASANIRCYAHVPDEMKQRLRKVREQYEADWRELIGKAHEAGCLDEEIDEDALRYALFGVMNWTLEWRRAGGPSPDQLGNMLFRIMFKGAAHRGVRN